MKPRGGDPSRTTAAIGGRVTFPTHRLPLAAIGAAIFRPSGLLSIRQVLSTSILVFLSVGTGVIMARGLGPTGRGELSAMMLWPALGAGLFTLGLRPAPHVHSGGAARRAAVPDPGRAATDLLYRSGGRGFGALVVPIWLEGYSPDVITFAQWAMLIAPVTLLLRSAKGILQARGEFGLYNRNHYVPPLISRRPCRPGLPDLSIRSPEPWLSSARRCRSWSQTWSGSRASSDPASANRRIRFASSCRTGFVPGARTWSGRSRRRSTGRC